MHRIHFLILAVTPTALADDHSSLLQLRGEDKPCDSVNGTYRDPTGGVVTIVQTGEKGCLAMAWTSTKVWPGAWSLAVSGNKLTAFTSNISALHKDGVITFPTGGKWTKIEDNDRKNMCSGAQDLESFAKYGPGNKEGSFPVHVADCSYHSMEHGVHQDNMTACLVKNLGLSPPCGQCFVDNHQWNFDNCYKECAAGIWCSSKCKKCRKSREAKLVECVGRDPPEIKTCSLTSYLKSSFTELWKGRKALWGGSVQQTAKNVVFKLMTGTNPTPKPVGY